MGTRFPSRSAIRRGPIAPLLAATLGLALLPVAASAQGAPDPWMPDPATIAGWMEQHRSIEHRGDQVDGTRPDATRLADWLRAHFVLEHRADLATPTGRLHQHVLRENAA